MREHHNDVRDMGRKYKVEQEQDDSSTRVLLGAFVRTLMEGYLGKQYMKKLEMPLCVTTGLELNYPDGVTDSKESDEDSEVKGCKWHDF